MRVIEASMEQRRNERAGETGQPRENPPSNGIVRHDSHIRKSGVTQPGIEPRSPWREASRLTAQPQWPRGEEGGIISPRRRMFAVAFHRVDEARSTNHLRNSKIACAENRATSLVRRNSAFTLVLASSHFLNETLAKSTQGATKYVAARECKGGRNSISRENPPTRDIVRQYSHVREFWSDPARNQTRFPLLWASDLPLEKGKVDLKNAHLIVNSLYLAYLPTLTTSRSLLASLQMMSAASLMGPGLQSRRPCGRTGISIVVIQRATKWKGDLSASRGESQPPGTYRPEKRARLRLVPPYDEVRDRRPQDTSLNRGGGGSNYRGHQHVDTSFSGISAEARARLPRTRRITTVFACLREMLGVLLSLVHTGIFLVHSDLHHVNGRRDLQQPVASFIRSSVSQLSDLQPNFLRPPCAHGCKLIKTILFTNRKHFSIKVNIFGRIVFTSTENHHTRRRKFCLTRQTMSYTQETLGTYSIYPTSPRFLETRDGNWVVNDTIQWCNKESRRPIASPPTGVPGILRNHIRLKIASQNQSRDAHKTPYDRVKLCWERKINMKASERVNVYGYGRIPNTAKPIFFLFHWSEEKKRDLDYHV
ncbi:hypothetical protein PR048_032930 [Dryococelus australis]|uniref:Uncharacterized protein n=1 Tax=Dryococelus australis TaxID=614101 RepID=A0ABQ9G3M4_9NEOP|nr:hypothetical protein PR048_032930 [Dryococelus australis]